jgi:hypothetical protein
MRTVLLRAGCVGLRPMPMPSQSLAYSVEEIPIAFIAVDDVIVHRFPCARGFNIPEDPTLCPWAPRPRVLATQATSIWRCWTSSTPVASR